MVSLALHICPVIDHLKENKVDNTWGWHPRLFWVPLTLTNMNTYIFTLFSQQTHLHVGKQFDPIEIKQSGNTYDLVNFLARKMQQYITIIKVQVLSMVSKALQDYCSFLSTASPHNMCYHDAGLLSSKDSLPTEIPHNICHCPLCSLLVSAAQLEHFFDFPKLLE